MRVLVYVPRRAMRVLVVSLCLRLAVSLSLSRDRSRGLPTDTTLEVLANVTSWDDPNSAQTGNIIFDTIPAMPSCEDIGKVFAKPSSHEFMNHSIEARRIHDLCVRHDGDLTKVPSLMRSSAEASVPRKPIYMLHVSKAAGTFFCECANSIGYNRGLDHDGTKNCHFLKEDGPVWDYANVPTWARISTYNREFGPHRDCDTLATVYAQQDITFENNENYLPNGNVCPQFHNIIAMRTPINRLASWLVSLHWLQDNAPAAAGTESVHSIMQKYPVQADNLYVRLLGGKEAFEAPFGSLTRKHLDRAKKALHSFDDVFIVGETLSDDVNSRLGWKCSGGQGRKSPLTFGTQGLLAHFQQFWPAWDWKALEPHLALDDELFKEAQMLNMVKSHHRKLNLEPSS